MGLFIPRRPTTPNDAITITKIQILRLEGRTDRIYLLTALPSTFPNMYPDTPAYFSCEVERNYGEQYVKQNFPNVPYEIING